MTGPRGGEAPGDAELGALFGAAAFHRTLGATIRRAAGGVEIDARPGGAFESIPGRLHGGVVASLLDSASTWALIAQTGEVFTTVDLRIDYLRPAPSGELTATGTIVALGSNVARATARLTGADGRCYATAAGTFVRVGLDRTPA